MNYAYVIAAVFASVYVFTYALWEKKQGNLPGAIFVFFLAMICLGLPVFRMITGP